MTGIFAVALVWSLYPAFYVAAVRDSEALMVFELGKLALTVGLACRPRCGGSMGMAGWQRSP